MREAPNSSREASYEILDHAPQNRQGPQDRGKPEKLPHPRGRYPGRNLEQQKDLREK